MKLEAIKPLLKKLTFTALGFLLFTSIAIVALPKLLQYGAINWLNKQGIEAEIDNIKIELHNGRFELTKAKGTNKNGDGFYVGYFKIDIDLLPLQDNIVIINAIEFDDFTIDIQHGESGIESVGGIALTGDNENSTSKDNMEESQPPKPWSIELKDIALNNIELCNIFNQSDRRICTNFDSLKVNGKNNLTTAPSIADNILINSQITIKNLSIIETVNNINILESESISINQLEIDSVENIALDSLNIQGLKILSAKNLVNGEFTKDTGSIDSLKFNNIHLHNKQHLSVNSIYITGIAAQIVINKHGTFDIHKLISDAMPRPDTKARPVNQTESITTNEKPITFSISTVSILNSHPLIFSDHSLKTPFTNSTIINHLTIKNIDTRIATTISEVTLNLIIDKHGELNLQGDLKNIADIEGFNITGNAKAIDLRSLSSYLEQPIGHKIKSGQLDADIKFSAKQGTIESLIKLDLNKLKLREVSKQEQQRLDKELGLGMPLDIALDLLRDNDDNININLPITGDIKSPEFNTSDIIQTAVTKGVTLAIINYYTPFGLVSASKGLFNLATALRFEPIIFIKGKSEITPSNQEILIRTSQLMQQRQKLRMIICGHTNKDDLAVVSPLLYSKLNENPKNTLLDDETISKLSTIGSDRSENIKFELIKNKIDASRLIICEPEYSPNGISGVELSL